VYVFLAAAVALESKIDGLIVSNTTIERPDSLKSAHKGEVGGLSGRPLLQMSTNVLRDMYRLTNGKVRCGKLSTNHHAKLSVGTILTGGWKQECRSRFACVCVSRARF
jgi:hypothetical protein